MARVFIRESQSKTHLTFEVNGQDIMCDLLAQADEFEVMSDGCEIYFILAEADYDWWQRWIEREERINDAYDEADSDTRKKYEKAIEYYSYDMERLQDELEAILGID